ncbi:hypothetical protein HUJ05_009328 [Dendroctonus ponderosae]|nr:hypothetical protein HUJ05_009328 [Dendroctonus ponderosae]
MTTLLFLYRYVFHLDTICFRFYRTSLHIHLTRSHSFVGCSVSLRLTGWSGGCPDFSPQETLRSLETYGSFGNYSNSTFKLTLFLFSQFSSSAGCAVYRVNNIFSKRFSGSNFFLRSLIFRLTTSALASALRVISANADETDDQNVNTSRRKMEFLTGVLDGGSEQCRRSKKPFLKMQATRACETSRRNSILRRPKKPKTH